LARQAATSAWSISLLPLVINAAHAFGMHVVAEDIETDDQCGLVRQLGCDSAQGYFIARPQPTEAITFARRSVPAAQ